MAYADALDPLIPGGGDQRRFGDDVIRQLTRATRQRLASIFVDVDADPLVLKNGVINTANLVDLLITTLKLADLAVTTAKIADAAVTNPKVAADAIATIHLINQAVTQAKLANLSVGTTQLIDASVTAIKMAIGSVLPGAIGAGTFGFDDVTSTAGYKVAGAAPAGQYLRGDGVHGVFSAIQAADLPFSADAVQVWRAASIDLVQGVLTAIGFDNEDFDTTNFHDNVVNNSRLVAPVNGRYRAYGTVSFTGLTADVFVVLRKNGVATNLTRCDLHVTNTSVGAAVINKIITLNAGDYVELYAQTNIIGNPDIQGGAEYTHFGLIRSS